MSTEQSILSSGVEHDLFEQLVIQGLKGSPAKDANNQYIDSTIRALYVGFVWGHVAGFSQGSLASREVFDTAFKAGAEASTFAPTEVGTSEGLRALDALLTTALSDLQVMLSAGVSPEVDLQISQFKHLLPQLLRGPAAQPEQLLAS